MEQTSLLSRSDGMLNAVSPMLELGAYEELWTRKGTSFKTLAELFQQHPGALPSDLVDHQRALEVAKEVLGILRDSAGRVEVRIHGTSEYPEKLRDARHPVEFLYYQGWWNLVETPCIAVVGTRRPSEEGIRRCRKLVRHLVSDGWTIISGLADGIDTAAQTTAIEAGGRTIGVLGTPISKAYPRSNRGLQLRLAREFLVISQVPVLRHSQGSLNANRGFFPARNHTMSALSEATIIVEAGETSGTLIQARGALQQGRKLFILDNCFQNRDLTWPAKFEKRGAIRVKNYSDIRDALALHQD